MPNKHFRGLWLRRGKERAGSRILLPLALGLLLAFLLIRWFDSSLRPQLITIAEAQLKNHLIQAANRSVTQSLAEESISYSDMVTLQTAQGVSTLVTDTASLNRLRSVVLDDVIGQLEALDSHSLSVPLGALTGIDLLSAIGPKLPVKIVSVASADGLYRNDFIDAGINQTLHRIMLDISVDAGLLLPGGVVKLTVTAPICISETVIIGQVPQTFLNWSP